MARRIYLFLLVCFCASHTLAADTLYRGGDSLNSTNTLVSKNGLFTLGITSLGSGESSASYLGIWYNNDTSHPFWLANRNKSIAENSGVLAIDGSGNMKLTYSGGDLVDFYSSRSSTTNLTAVLEDTVNLVLKDKNSGGQQDLWRSFGDPTDTFLPGMKLGINHATNQTWSLMSWLSDVVPTPAGPLTFEWDRKGKELVIKRRDVIHWTSGPLTSNTRFEIFFLNTWSLDYSFINVSYAGEDYIMFTVSSNQFTPQYQRIFLIRPLCRSSRNSFNLRRGSFVNTVTRKSDDNSSLSISDYKDICWKKCSCSGVTTRGNKANNTGCAIQVSSG
ncbi:PAN-LIKE DOMAIN PROTEIN [Salix koriyanagi]|uniref:non-specific serine/threonine protein kinase n=1 Tax=Salix koriyanagi TaxID=2511006 RepID=A0A9Q0X156_9ROSI|nr:PAN-LIKE DOMAIN PROTEIN [Salix koriyanagi]